MAKKKTMYCCSTCGHNSSRWLGKCPQCGEWNTMVEEVVVETKGQTGRTRIDSEGAAPRLLRDIATESMPRQSSGYAEVDRVLGGGIVPGALVLLGGDPGIGKSTLVMQLSGALSRQGGHVLYASGEESQLQLRLRADRLGVSEEQVTILADTQLDRVLVEAQRGTYTLLVIDSIQTMFTEDLEMAPGSVGQVRECTARLLRFAKEANLPVLIIGHVTKEGNIAGPRMLEHMVDVVLYFEGERSYQFRVLRAIKNRFGSTAETGIFSMEAEGLREVANPSALLLADRSAEETGSAVMAYLEGLRPVLVEAQSLVTPTAFGMPRRTSIGYDLNRLLLLLAVLEKKAHVHLGNQDVYVNVIGGLKVNEPACDLAMAMAIVSSYKDQPVPQDMAFIGEVGLTGNIRSVPRVDQRIQEAAKLGFRHFIVPAANAKQSQLDLPGVTVQGVTHIAEALRTIFPPVRGK